MEINFKESELDAMLQGEHQKPYAEKEYLEEELVSGDSGTADELNEAINKAMRDLLLSKAGYKTEIREPKKRGLGTTRKPASRRKR